MKFVQIGGRFRLSRYSLLFGLLALFISAGIQTGITSAAPIYDKATPPPYADVNRDGWTYFIDSPSSSIIIAVKNGDTGGKQAIFHRTSDDGYNAVYTQQPDYYNTTYNQPAACAPAKLTIISSSILGPGEVVGDGTLEEDQGTCGENPVKYDEDGYVDITEPVKADIKEIAALNNNGYKPLGCPGYPDIVYTGTPDFSLNYNCPDGVNSVKAGAPSTGTIARKTTSTSVSGDPTAGDGSDVAMTDCEMTYNPISWIMCPIIDGVFAAVRGLDSLITRLLIIDTSRVFGTGPESSTDAAVVASNNYYEAWSSFRNLALGLVVITALIIIISSAFGIDMLDAYTIRKALPRVFIAVIGIAISWEVTEFLINLTNDIGVAVRGLIYAPFSDMEALQINGLSKFIIGGLLSAAIIVYQWAVLLFGLTAFIGIMIALLTLVVREMILIFLVIIAPIALVAFILPNTQKYWQLWQNTFTTLLVVFPIIAGFIALGRVFSTLAYQAGQGGSETVMNLIAFVAYFLPYFLIPLAFKMAGGIMATLAGIGNDRSKGVFDRLSKARGSAAKNNYQDALEERGRVGNSFIGAAYRRARFAGSGGLSVTQAGRDRYGQELTKFRGAVAAKNNEDDKGRVGGDDDLTELLSTVDPETGRFRTRAEVIDQYAARQVAAGRMDADTAQSFARQQVAAAEVGFRAQVGDASMVRTAWMANKLSSTGDNQGEQELGENIADIYNSGLDLVNRGLMSTTDLVATIKKKQARSEVANVSFGLALGTLGNAQARAREDGGPARITLDEARNLLGDAVTGTGVNDYANAKPETVRVAAQVHVQRALQASADHGVDSPEHQEQLAHIAALYDLMGHLNPQKRQAFGDILMAQQTDATNEAGEALTYNQLVEQVRAGTRPNERYLQLRREYSNELARRQAENGQNPEPPQL